MTQAQATTLQAHEAYLAFSEGVFKTLSEAVQTQLDLVARAAGGASLAQFTRGPLTPALCPGGGEGEELAQSVSHGVTAARAGDLQSPTTGSDVVQSRRLQVASTDAVPQIGRAHV